MGQFRCDVIIVRTLSVRNKIIAIVPPVIVSLEKLERYNFFFLNPRRMLIMYEH